MVTNDGNFIGAFRTKIDIDDPDTLSIKIEDGLTPDTEYVFKIRAIYASGAGVFSEPCIMKTLPEGRAQFARRRF